jgi:hypothetical protein
MGIQFQRTDALLLVSLKKDGSSKRDGRGATSPFNFPDAEMVSSWAMKYAMMAT